MFARKNRLLLANHWAFIILAFMREFAVLVRNLVKNYGSICALKGVDFEIRSGELFALLGPNGAGKTTTIRILCGLTRPGGGQAYFFGINIFERPLDAKKMAGLVPQTVNLDLELTVLENLYIHGLLFGLGRKKIAHRARGLLEFAELYERRHDKVRTLSGGLRRRLLIIRALMHEPKILFLDEPTIGLDPHIRRKLWGFIKRIQQDGTTILLTTHYIEEAEFLADRVAFINKGKIVVIDTPRNLIESLGEVAIDIIDEQGLTTKYFRNRAEAKAAMLELSKSEKNFTLRRISLEDAFVYFIGRRV